MALPYRDAGRGGNENKTASIRGTLPTTRVARPVFTTVTPSLLRALRRRN